MRTHSFHANCDEQLQPAVVGTTFALTHGMWRALAVAMLIFTASCGHDSPSLPNSGTVQDGSEKAEPDGGRGGPDTESAHAAPVGFDMRHVHLRVAPAVVLQVEQLHGRLVPRSSREPAFDDPKSFYIAVESAKLSMDGPSMTAIVNRVFDYKGSPLREVAVTIRDGRVEQKGQLRKGVWIPFSIQATVSADGGLIRLHPVELRVAGIPAAKMMSFFGLELDEVIKVRTGRGVSVRDNDLLLETSQMMPAPEVRGKVTSARVEGDRLHLVMGGPPAAQKGLVVPDSNAQHFIWFHGSRIRFGRLTMSEADLQLIDADEQDPFDFYADRYNEQVVAGFSRNTPGGGLRAVLPDYEDISRLPSSRLPDPTLAPRRTQELTQSVR